MKAPMVPLTAMVLLGSLLLFGMEPLVGRLVVPFYGGAVHVWTTCLMLFQLLLLLGYVYAHYVAPRIGRWHLLVLAIPLVAMPLRIHAEPAPDAPLFDLLATLVFYVSLPFAALSTTAVVAQTWLARSDLGKEQEPYPLYAASNVGSLVALLGYPFLVEPFLGLTAQRLLWSAAYIVYLGVAITAWFTARPGDEVQAPPSVVDAGAPTSRQIAMWLVLSALPSAFLLGVTNVIATEVGSFPLVWVLPLALYLSTFIICFRDGGGVPRIGLFWPEATVVGLVFATAFAVQSWVIIPHLLTLFILCVVAHGTLYEWRPHPKYLTGFYVAMSVGGWLGGAAVSLLAPAVFTGLHEYQASLLLLAAAILYAQWEETKTWWADAPIWKAGPRMGVIAMGLVFLGVAASVALQTDTRFRHRNFYGTYRIVDSTAGGGAVPTRELFHGSTMHGAQIREDARSGEALAYYAPPGCIAEVWQTAKPKRSGVVGLGAGVLSTFLEPGQELVYYEIDDDNEWIARQWFGFLGDTRGDVSVIVGDARLRLQTEDDRRPYDLIMVDAFSGDGIPTHLLTREALEIYLSRLGPDGVLLFHISSRFYDLRPVIKATASELGLVGQFRRGPADQDLYVVSPTCMLLARDEAALDAFPGVWVPAADADGLPAFTPWTDDYVDLLAAMNARRKGW